jgi:hypothetical protein
MAPEEDEARLLAKALRASGWYDPMSTQTALYRWSATGLPLGEIRAWLTADIADPIAALEFRDLAIGPDEVRAARVGERVTVGSLSIEDAARSILGPRADAGLPAWRAMLREYHLAGADLPTQQKELQAWWRTQIRRLEEFLDDEPAPAELVGWLREQPDHLLLAYRDAAVQWARPLTIAIARREHADLGGALRPGGPTASDPLVGLTFGALSARELARRLGERVETAITSPPVYLTAMLGSYPQAGSAQLLWTQAALVIEGFRLECGIDHPDQALGDPDVPLPLNQFHEVNRALPWIRTHLERASTEAQAEKASEVVESHDRGLGLLLDSARMRPDEELAQRVTTWLRTLPAVQLALGRPATDADVSALGWRSGWTKLMPAWQQAWIAGKSDEGLAGEWDLAVRGHLRGDQTDQVLARERLAHAATVLAEIDRRVTSRVEAASADPPTYIINAVGPYPSNDDARDLWESTVDQIESYRLLTGTTDPVRALGPTPSPDSSWQQSWRRELAQDLVDAWFARMDDQHRVIGTPEERNELTLLEASAVDPWLGVRPDAGMLEEGDALATGELRRRVAVAAPLLIDRPENRSVELRAAQLRRAALLDHQQQARAALKAARAARAEGPLLGRDARAARAAIRQHQQTLAGLRGRLLESSRELTGLEQAQAAYFAWCREHALPVTQGQAAAQALRARETGLLESLADYPPAYLLAELGQPPTNPDGRAAWRRGAQAIERHRATYNIDERESAFGDQQAPTRWERPGRSQDQQRVRDLVDDVRQAITDSLANELDQGLSIDGLDQDPPSLAIGA